MITNDVIESSVKCKYKGYLKFNNKVGNKTEFECLEHEILEGYIANFHDHLRVEFGECQIFRDFDFEKKFQVKSTTFVIEPLFRSREYDIKLDAIEISPNKSSPRKSLYIPIQISPKEKISRIEKLTLSLKCLVVSQLTKITPEFGKIVYGHGLKTTKFSLTTYSKEAKKLLTELEEIAKSGEAPGFQQNTHCSICEFQEPCRVKLIEKDDLSLLGSVLVQRELEFWLV